MPRFQRIHYSDPCRGSIIRKPLLAMLMGLGLLTISACSSHDSTPQQQAARTVSLTDLGDKIFHDPALSASERLSCATCHDKQHGFAQANTDAIAFGGPNMDLPGSRNTPSLSYLAFNSAFYFDREGTPTGGFTRDGRANSFAEQAIRPFLTSFEMANASVGDVTDKLAHASYANDFRQLFGDQIFSDPDRVFAAAREALQAYQTNDPDFAPFTSKYDYFLEGKVKLTDQELRGLASFNNPDKGNCASCHPSAMVNKQHPLFTDFTYDNLGVPRNDNIDANKDPNYFDLGLCGPLRTDLADRNELCGAFKVPTLRNVAVTAPYFHNGKFNTLREVVSFYVRRDTNPEEFYPLGANGLPQKFNDLPAEYAGNVNTTEAPYNRHEGELPALSS
ncbi:MAG: cytochrome c peroxidase, partial [Steroidobacter sp.]